MAELQDSLLSQELQFTQELGNRERKCAAYATELEQLKSQVDDLTVDLATATAQLEEARGRTGTDDAARDAEVRGQRLAHIPMCPHPLMDATAARPPPPSFGGASHGWPIFWLFFFSDFFRGR